MFTQHLQQRFSTTCRIRTQHGPVFRVQHFLPQLSQWILVASVHRDHRQRLEIGMSDRLVVSLCAQAQAAERLDAIEKLLV